MQGVKYQLGDCCYLVYKPDGEPDGTEPWIGRISSFWSYEGDPEYQKYAKVQRFWTPEQTDCGRMTEIHGRKECFSTVYEQVVCVFMCV
jgi:hypothetical protein